VFQRRFPRVQFQILLKNILEMGLLGF